MQTMRLNPGTNYLSKSTMKILEQGMSMRFYVYVFQVNNSDTRKKIFEIVTVQNFEKKI